MISSRIHQTAVISPSAVIGDGVEIGAFSVIGDNVTIGARCVIGHHVVIEGHTVLGEDNRVSHFAAIGSPPQDIKYAGEVTRVSVGRGNVIREYVTINRGTPQGAGITRVGDGNFIMIGCHIAHDCVVGSGVIMANMASLAGHVHVDDGVVFGGMAGVHQFVRVGSLAMVAGAAMVVKDVPPFTMAAGDRAKLYGLNVVGLRRRKLSPETINGIKDVFTKIFRSGLPRKEALDAARDPAKKFPETQAFFSFVEGESKRGFCAAVGQEEEWTE